MSETLTWLQNWYKSQCDGEWEHEYGVKVYTLDNPGWAITIDLVYTELDGVEIKYELFEKSENDWYGYSIEKNIFSGAGDPDKLELIINVFRDLVKSRKK